METNKLNLSPPDYKSKPKSKLWKKVLIGAVIVYFGFHIFSAVFEDQIKDYHTSKIQAEISYDPSFCQYESPLKVVIHNKSSKNVSHFRFDVYVFKQGEVGYINEPLYSMTQIDVPIPMKGMYINCFKVPLIEDPILYNQPSKLLYKLGNIHYYFE